MKVLIGIDPGLRGAIAVLAGRDLVHVADMPVVPVSWAGKTRNEVSPALLYSLLASIQHEHGKATMAVVERVSASPQMGRTSAFRFGEGYGAVNAVLACAGISAETVVPGKWKKALGLTSVKDASRGLAMKRWPDCAEMFERKKDDGRAEAALLAEYIRRRENW